MRKKNRSPQRDALLLSLFYFGFAATWVLTTSALAERIARNIEQMTVIEQFKGVGFMIFSAILLYFFSYHKFSRIAESNERVIHSQQSLFHSEQRALQGLIASSIMHDFNNILTVLRFNVEKLRSFDYATGKEKSFLDQIDLGLTRLQDLVQKRRHSEKILPNEKARDFDVVGTAQEALEFLSAHRSIRNCHLQLVAEDKMTWSGYPIFIHQILLNLILNAAEATNRKGQIFVSLRRMGSQIQLNVEDSGPGVPEEKQARIFEAFYTEKTGGSGLGLTSVKATVEACGGYVKVFKSERFGGAHFRAVLPDLRPE